MSDQTGALECLNLTSNDVMQDLTSDFENMHVTAAVAESSLDITYSAKPITTINRIDSLSEKDYRIRSIGHNGVNDTINLHKTAIAHRQEAHITRNGTTYDILCHPHLGEILNGLQNHLISDYTRDNSHIQSCVYKPPIVFIPTCENRIIQGNLWDGYPKKSGFGDIKHCIKFIVMSENDRLDNQTVAKELQDNQFILVHNEHSIVLIRECIKKFAEELKRSFTIDFDYYMNIDDDIQCVKKIVWNETKKEYCEQEIDPFIQNMVTIMNDEKMKQFCVLSLNAQRKLKWCKKQKYTVIKSTKCETFCLFRLCDELKQASYVTGKMLKPFDISNAMLQLNDIDEINEASKEYKANNMSNIFSLTHEEWLQLKKLRASDIKYQYLFQGEDFGICENLLKFDECIVISENEHLVRGIQTRCCYLHDFIPWLNTELQKDTKAGTVKVNDLKLKGKHSSCIAHAKTTPSTIQRPTAPKKDNSPNLIRSQTPAEKEPKIHDNHDRDQKYCVGVLLVARSKKNLMDNGYDISESINGVSSAEIDNNQCASHPETSKSITNDVSHES